MTDYKKDASAPQSDRELSLIVNQKLDFFAEKLAELAESIKRIETIKFEAMEERIFSLEKEIAWGKGMIKGLIAIVFVIEILANVMPYLKVLVK